MVTALFLRTVTRELTEPQCIRTNQKFHHKFSVFECMKIAQNYPYLCLTLSSPEGDQFKVNMGEKKLISNIDIEMYLTLLGNI